MKSQFHYSEESFGVIFALQDGRVRICEKTVLPLIEEGSELNDRTLLPHRLKTISFDPKSFHLRQPLIAWIELTRACNCECLHCYIDAGKPRAHEMSTEQILRLINDLDRQNVFYLVLTGGEPLLHPDILKILHHACSKRFSVSLLTNGTLITDKFVATMPRENLAVGVSLDGLHSSQQMRGKQGDAETIKKGLIKLRDHGIPVGVTSILTKVNIEEMAPLIDWCLENELLVSPSFAVAFAGRMLRNSHILPSAEDAKAYANLISTTKTRKKKILEKNRFKSTGYWFGSLMKALWYLSYLTNCCEGARGIVYVTSEGDVYPCTNCASANMYKQNNVLEKPFEEVWKEDFLDFRSITYDDFKGCATCDLKQEGWICSGKCPPLSYNLHSDPLICGFTDFQKESVRQRGVMYLRDHGSVAHQWSV